MSSSTLFYTIADLAQFAFAPFEMIGDLVNYAFILLGFVGLVIWLTKQKKFNDSAASDPNQLK
jgi:hypothetical protein